MSHNRTCPIEYIENIKIGLENANQRVNRAQEENLNLTRKVQYLELKAQKLRNEVSSLEHHQEMTRIVKNKSDSRTYRKHKRNKRHIRMFDSIGRCAVVALASIVVMRCLKK